MLFTSFNQAFGFQFIGAVYLNFVLIAMWALVRTYNVGPGYTTDHFKSVKIEFLNLGQSERASNREDNDEQMVYEIGTANSARS